MCEPSELACVSLQEKRLSVAMTHSLSARKRKDIFSGIIWCFSSYYFMVLLPWPKKNNHPCDASCDIEESAVWFRCDASMREVAAVASRVRSRFRSWIKLHDSSISQDSDFMHQQYDAFFFFVQGSRYVEMCKIPQVYDFAIPSTNLLELKQPWFVLLVMCTINGIYFQTNTYTTIFSPLKNNTQSATLVMPHHTYF